ncbi:MAG TPA: hemerythrin domain-containing protein [Candidatus Limnocylindrales bacterium]|jgi:hypothetical protein|nr:hemerythrin domain-containing protein [Candidatus Limnocylindrales bacterium]
MTRTALASHAMRAFAEHEHVEIRPGIDQIREAAIALSEGPRPEAVERVRHVCRWIDLVLAPHMAWEEGWLYPQLDELAGTDWATRSIRFDHRQIARLAGRVRDRLVELGRADGPHTRIVERDLFALEAMLDAHLEREERYLLPLLDGERVGAEGVHR